MLSPGYLGWSYYVSLYGVSDLHLYGVLEILLGLEQMVKGLLSDGLIVCNIPKALCLH